MTPAKENAPDTVELTGPLDFLSHQKSYVVSRLKKKLSLVFGRDYEKMRVRCCYSNTYDQNSWTAIVLAMVKVNDAIEEADFIIDGDIVKDQMYDDTMFSLLEFRNFIDRESEIVALTIKEKLKGNLSDDTTSGV